MYNTYCLSLSKYTNLMKILLKYLSSLLLILLGACNGSFDYPPTVRTLLTGGTVKEWEVERIFDLKDGLRTDVTQNCNLDDDFVFYEDGTLELRDNLNRCDAQLEQTDSRINWLLDPQDQSIIYLRFSPNIAPFKTTINRISEQELELEITIDFTNQRANVFQLKAKGLFL